MKSSLSFEKQLVKAQSELFRFAFRLTANHDDASDLLQETSLKALVNESMYSPNTNFNGWVYTIMRNIFINNYRKTAREQTYGDSTENQYYLNFAKDSMYVNTEQAYDAKEIRSIVKLLGKEYWQPLFMYVYGFKYREISEKMHVPIGTIKSRIFFSRQKLQRLLKDFR